MAIVSNRKYGIVFQQLKQHTEYKVYKKKTDLYYKICEQWIDTMFLEWTQWIV